MKKIIFLTGGSSWVVPDDWNNTDNRVICIGAGGGGANSQLSGGGGGCSAAVNMVLTPGDAVSYQIGVGGTGGAASIGSPATINAGASGTDTWFVSSSTLLAKGGQGGYSLGTNTRALGGQASSGIGDIRYSGGNGGLIIASQYGGCGGGGAASDTSGGYSSSDSLVNNGAPGGDSGSGAAGGAGATSGINGSPGNPGAEWTATDVWTGTAYRGASQIGGAGAGGGGGYGSNGVSQSLGGRGGGFGGGGAGSGYISSLVCLAGANGADGGIILVYEGKEVIPVPALNKAELFFSESVQELLAGRNIFTAMGVWFDFTSGEERVWLGRGTFTARDGTEWSGLGTLASIDGIQSSAGLSTEPITMTLSGLDTEILDLTRAQASEIRGRRCGVYILMFNETGQPIDEPYLIDLYLMDKASFTVSGESREMSITVTAEPLFSTKHVPKFSLMTDQDQQTRYPGDKIFERVALMAGRQTVVWSSDT